jgi:Transposase DDE domain group 1
MAVVGGKLAAKRADCAPLAGKSTLNRLELSRAEPTRYHKISSDAAAIEGLFVDLFLAAHAAPPSQITLDFDATDDPLHGHQEGRFFHGDYDTYCYLPLCGVTTRAVRSCTTRQNVAETRGFLDQAATIKSLATMSIPNLAIRGRDGQERKSRCILAMRNLAIHVGYHRLAGT